jgi:hypothetical protein
VAHEEAAVGKGDGGRGILTSPWLAVLQAASRRAGEQERAAEAPRLPAAWTDFAAARAPCFISTRIDSNASRASPCCVTGGRRRVSPDVSVTTRLLSSDSV